MTSRREKNIYCTIIFIIVFTVSCKKENKKEIVCWGDSLTAQNEGKLDIAKNYLKTLLNIGTPNTSYPQYLEQSLNEEYGIINCGIGGENTLTIMSRQGAYPMLINRNITLPASTNPVTIGHFQDSILISSYDNRIITPLFQGKSCARINNCTINGIECILKWEGKGVKIDSTKGKKIYIADSMGVYTIERAESGKNEAKIKKGTPIVTWAMKNLRNAYVNIFFMGQNGGFKDSNELITQYKSMIKYSNCNRFIIIGYHKPNSATPSIKSMIEMENNLTKQFGRNYINLRLFLNKKGLASVDLKANKEDLDSIKKGLVPPQLMKDGCHFKPEGYQIIARLVKERLKELKYIN